LAKLSKRITAKVNDVLARYEIVGQFVRYATVGVFNVAFFLALYNGFLWARVETHVSYVLAFAITNVTSFLLNKRWAFRDRERDAVMRQYLRFASFTLIGLGISTGAFSAFLHLTPLERHGTLGKNIAALAAVPFSVAWNFFSYRRWTFRWAVPASSVAAERSPRASGR
jgi:putative flippase GtrA